MYKHALQIERSCSSCKTAGQPSSEPRAHLRLCPSSTCKPPRLGRRDLSQCRASWILLRSPNNSPTPVSFNLRGAQLTLTCLVATWHPLLGCRSLLQGQPRQGHALHINVSQSPKAGIPSWNQAGKIGRASSFVPRKQLMSYLRGNPRQTESQELSMPLCAFFGGTPTPIPYPPDHRLYLGPSLSDTCLHPGSHQVQLKFSPSTLLP